MITKITISLADDQELEVFPDWEGNTQKTVTIKLKDIDKPEEGESPAFHATLIELRELVEASEFVLKGQKE